ncbi:hypothetical protein ACVME8_006061 [Bradyrhizobium diazoefficiens]
MTAVDHRFALSRPALVSAPDKKSFSNASSPILACNPVGRSKSPGYGHLKLPHLMIAVSAAEQQ